MQTRRTQQAIFFFFILLFFASAPLVVLYTAGYRWSPDIGIVRTGTLFVASTPKDATISINGQTIRDTTPAIIKTLKPAPYQIQLTLAGHLPWSKTLPIREGETTFIDHVILFLDNPPQLLAREPMHNVAWSAQKERIAWANHQAGWTEIWVAGISLANPRLVYRTELNTDIVLAWEDAQSLAILSRGITQRVSSEGVALAEPTQPPVQFHTNKDSVDVLVGEVVLARLPFGTYRVLDQRGSYILVQDTARQRISLLTNADAAEPLLLQEDATFVEWIREDALLFATEHAISLYEPARHQTTLVTRISEQIRAVAWHPQGRYVFFVTDTDARVIELDDRDGRHVTPLATMESIESLFLSPRGEDLYLVGSNGIDVGLYVQHLYND